MYIAGLHIPHSPTELAEPLIWSTILISHVRFGLRQRKTMVHADKTAGGIKRMPTSTLSRFVLPAHGLASLAAPAVYILALPFSGFRQPEWFGKFALPDFPALGEGGTLAVRLLAGVAVVSIFELAAGAMEHLGKQFHFFGVSLSVKMYVCISVKLQSHRSVTNRGSSTLAHTELFVTQSTRECRNTCQHRQN